MANGADELPDKLTRIRIERLGGGEDTSLTNYYSRYFASSRGSEEKACTGKGISLVGQENNFVPDYDSVRLLAHSSC